MIIIDRTCSHSYFRLNTLVEWVGACSPIGEEQAETDGFEHAAKSTNGKGIYRSLLNQDSRHKLLTNSLATVLLEIKSFRIGTYRWGSRCKENQTTEVGSTLVCQGTSGINESSNTISLETRSDE
jgi:hypothetical protein